MVVTVSRRGKPGIADTICNVSKIKDLKDGRWLVYFVDENNEKQVIQVPKDSHRLEVQVNEEDH